jgi:hypothetical protein
VGYDDSTIIQSYAAGNLKILGVIDMIPSVDILPYMQCKVK